MANRQSVTQPDDWEDITDWEDVPSQQVTTPSLPQAEPGFLESVYNTVFQAPEFVTKPATQFAESMMPGLETSPTMARIKGFIGGAAEGASELLSPANILTMGRGRLPQLAARVLGASQAAHGIGDIAQGDIAQGVGDIAFGALSGTGGKIKRVGKAVTGEAPITAESFGPDFWKTPEKPLTPEQGKTIKHALENIPEIKGQKIQSKAKSAPMGQVIILKKEGATPDIVKKTKEAGFEFEGLNDQGNFRFKKTREIGEAQPVLESEVGAHRPTVRGATEQLGPPADIRKASAVAEVFNLPRAMKASMDFSAPLRQGVALIHKPEFWKSIKPMMKSWATEEAFQQSQKDIASRPLFRKRAGPEGKILPSFADDAGLKLSDLTDLNSREEAIMSTWAEKVPGVRRSNRAYTAFLNNLRADTFESLVRDSNVFGADAKANLPLARALADFVNTASGRGKLPGRLEQSAATLNSLLFSPRLIASRLKMLNPHFYLTANPVVRKEALKSLFAVAAVGNTVGQLGRMAGGEVGMDPSSSDFGKVKIGNTRIDPYGGFQQYVVAANRLLNPLSQKTTGADTPFTRGQQVTSTRSGKEYDLWNPQPGPYDPTWTGVLGRFGRGKLHPTLEFAYSIFSGGKDITGKELDFTTINPIENALAQQFIPILAQDIWEVAQTNPELLPVTAPLSTFGMSVQSYED